MSDPTQETEPFYIAPVKAADVPEKAQLFRLIEGLPENPDDVVFMRMVPVPSVANSIMMESGVSMYDGHPFVSMRWEGGQIQMRPDDAIAHALNVIRAVAGAEQDALLHRGLKRNGMGPQESLAMISLLREERAIGWSDRPEPPQEGLIVP